MQCPFKPIVMCNHLIVNVVLLGTWNFEHKIFKSWEIYYKKIKNKYLTLAIKCYAVNKQINLFYWGRWDNWTSDISCGSKRLILPIKLARVMRSKKNK